MINDAAAFQFVRDAHTELDLACKIAEPKHWTGPDEFCCKAARYIEKGVAGYIVLRSQPMTLASQLIIRPLIETALALEAVSGRPEQLYRRAYYEHCQDKKWIESYGHKREEEKEALEGIRKHWENFDAQFRAQFPQANPVKSVLDAGQAALVIGAGKFYDAYYRLYCRYSHAMLRAISGSLTGFDTQDNGVVALCCMTALRFLSKVGIKAARLDELEARFPVLGLD